LLVKLWRTWKSNSCSCQFCSSDWPHWAYVKPSQLSICSKIPCAPKESSDCLFNGLQVSLVIINKIWRIGEKMRVSQVSKTAKGEEEEKYFVRWYFVSCSKNRETTRIVLKGNYSLHSWIPESNFSVFIMEQVRVMFNKLS
jgi:hypothetical protein